MISMISLCLKMLTTLIDLARLGINIYVLFYTKP